MGSFKKFVWSLISIVLIILASFLLTIALVEKSVRIDILQRLDDINYRYALMVLSAILFIFALILIVDILVHKNQDREYLIESNSGDVFITSHSLEAVVESSISKFPYVLLDYVDVIIIDSNKIQASVRCDVYGQRDFKSVGEEIQKEIIYGLKTLTGIEDVVTEIQLNKAVSSHARELR